MEEIELTVVGVPNADFQIWYRGDRESEDPAPIVYTGQLDATGRRTLFVPRAYLLIGRPTRAGGVSLGILEMHGSRLTFALPDRGE